MHRTRSPDAASPRGGRRRSLDEAGGGLGRLVHAVVVAAVLACIPARTALGQTYLYEHAAAPGQLSAFSHRSALAAFGWQPVVFPARRDRAYRRPPRLGAFERFAAASPHLAEAALLFSLPLAYLRAVAEVESKFDPRALSVDGAMGVMQLMPFTARKMGVVDPFDARQNILGGARFLRILANQWRGDIERTTASYNAGAGAVLKYGGVPPYRETRRYVARVLRLYRSYAAEASCAPPATRAPTLTEVSQ
jgi:soluble lytic murein transglycosylase-like protein